MNIIFIFIFILIFIIILIVIFLIKQRYNDKYTNFKGKRIIGNVTNDNYIDSINEGRLDILIGKEKTNGFLTSGNNYFFKGIRIEKKESSASNDDTIDTIYRPFYYLNTTGGMCKETSNTCFKKENGNVGNLVFTNLASAKSQINETVNSGIWNFNSADNSPDKKIYYGQIINIRNISDSGGYICVCPSSRNLEKSFNTCGSNMSIQTFDNKDKVKEYGEWIIVPRYGSIYNSQEKTYDLFHKNCNNENMEEMNESENKDTVLESFTEKDVNISQLDYIKNLLNKKIPIRIGTEIAVATAAATASTTDNNETYTIDNGDIFYILNKNKFNGNFLFLSSCLNVTKDFDDSYKIKCKQPSDDNKTIKESLYESPVGISKKKIGLTNQDLAWNISKVNYNINVNGTLYIKDKLKLGDSFITADTLRKIKKIPYLFKDEVCLINSNGNKTCMRSEHIEMLRGERNLTIQAFIRLKPYTLYSKPDYLGRELKIGFNYKHAKNLPFIPFSPVKNNKTEDHYGLWKSIKVESPYKIVIYDSPLEIKEETKSGSCNSLKDKENVDACNIIKPLKRVIADKDTGETKLDTLKNTEEQYKKCMKVCNEQSGCEYFKEPNDQDIPSAGVCEPLKSGEVLVVLYENPDNGGDPYPLDRLGGYKFDELKKIGYKDNSLSYMSVSKGYKITLYEHDNYSGRSRTFYSGTYNGRKGLGYFADRMSSLKILRDHTVKRKVVSENIKNISNGANNKKKDELNWPWGIRAVSFPYDFSSNDGNTMKIIEDPIRKKCLAKLADKEHKIYANECTNTENQRFKIKSRFNSGPISKINNIFSNYSSDHLHLHKHELLTIHDDSDKDSIQ